VRVLAPRNTLGLDGFAGLGDLMKQSRETAPLWVWLTFGLIGLGIIAYAAGYMVLEDIFALIK